MNVSTRFHTGTFVAALALFALLLAAGCDNAGKSFKKDKQPCGITPELKDACNMRKYKLREFGPNGLMSVELRKTKLDESGRPFHPVGCLDKDKKEIIPLKYGMVFFGPDVICVRTTDNKFGMFDLNGKEIVPCEYDYINFVFYGNYIIVKKGSLFGVMNNKGELVIPVQYDQIRQFYDYWYLGLGMDKYKFEDVFCLTKNGDFKVVNLSRSLGSTIGNHVETPFDYQGFERNGKYGIVNYLGEEIAPQYQNLRESYLGESVDFSEGPVAVVKNNKIGFIDKKGVVRIPFQFYYSEFWFNFHKDFGLFSEGLAPMMKPGNKWGYIDTKGNTVIPFVYDYASCFHKGVAIVYNETGRCGLIDKNNSVVLPFEFETGGFSGTVYNPDDTLYIMRQNGKWGVFTPTGTCLTPCQYEQVDFLGGGYATVVKNGKQGLINKQCQLLIPCEYEVCLYDVFSGMVGVVKDGKWGFLNTQNHVLVPTKFDQVNPSKTGDYFVVTKNDKRGFYDLCGNLIWIK